ncbi:MAG: hypothetical protein ISR72_11480 [Methylobacter sp.]|nr:hypothetical protein [Methylobacter sp.]
MNQTPLVDNALVEEIKQLIQSAKQRAVVAVNAELTLLYWQVGKCIADEVLGGERAEYGKQVIDNLAHDLTVAFGKSWNKKQLHHCLRFAEAFPEPEIVSALRRQLSWTHFKSLIYLDDSLKREFYLAMAVQERWSTRTLAERIDKQLFERSSISRKPKETIIRELALLREQGLVNENLILKDPYILDFGWCYSESCTSGCHLSLRFTRQANCA